jgi:hypothetical protein
MTGSEVLDTHLQHRAHVYIFPRGVSLDNLQRLILPDGDVCWASQAVNLCVALLRRTVFAPVAKSLTPSSFPMYPSMLT